jgi:hypothetical protein
LQKGIHHFSLAIGRPWCQLSHPAHGCVHGWQVAELSPGIALRSLRFPRRARQKDEAARHYDEKALAALALAIAAINFWNRLNVTTRQVAGEWVKSAEAQRWLESVPASR